MKLIKVITIIICYYRQPIETLEGIRDKIYIIKYACPMHAMPISLDLAWTFAS